MCGKPVNNYTITIRKRSYQLERGRIWEDLRRIARRELEGKGGGKTDIILFKFKTSSPGNQDPPNQKDRCTHELVETEAS